MKRNAFTLREILIVLLMVGILSVLSLQTVKAQKAKFSFSCYHFFRDLKIAVGHMASSAYGGSLNSFSCESALDNEDDDITYRACLAAGNANSTHANMVDYRTGKGFCTGLSKYLGTVSTTKCDENDLTSATLSNIYGQITADTIPNFKLMNKSLVYLSKRNEGGKTGSTYNTYRILSVDLNGSSYPNKVGEDIISFAIFDNGEILPLGEAADSNNFFTAVIKVRNILPMPANKKDDVLNALRHPASLLYSSKKKPLTFRQAYCDVYGTSDNYADYCNGHSMDDKFNYGGKDMSVSYCINNKYNADGSVAQKFDGQDIVPECELTVIKPQVSKFFPITQDIYSSKGNVNDLDEDNQANQIYKY